MELNKKQIVPIAVLGLIAASLFIVIAPVAAQSLSPFSATAATATTALPATKTVQWVGNVYIKVSNDTINFYKVNTTLTLNLEDSFRGFIFVSNVNGSVNINGDTYTITDGKGILLWHHGVLDCAGVDSNGNTLNFTLRGMFKVGSAV